MSKNPHAQELALRRSLSLSPERRKEIAMKANAKRWEGHVKKSLSTGSKSGT